MITWIEITGKTYLMFTYLAVRQNLESRIYFWPGSETNPGINGLLPTEYMKFDFKVTMKQQVDKIIEWADKGTDLMMMYKILLIKFFLFLI